MEQSFELTLVNHSGPVTPSYYLFDCVPTPQGGLRVVDVHGSVGRGLAMLDAAYGGRSAAARRLLPYMQRLGELAAGRRILFVIDPFRPRQPFPDDFFTLVQNYSAYGPLTDWVPDLQTRPAERGPNRIPDAKQMGMFLDPLARRLRLQVGYCSNVRLDHADRPSRRGSEPGSHLLLSDFRERERHRGRPLIVPTGSVGVVLFSGASERFPDDLRAERGFPCVNPPLLDQALESKWLLPLLLAGTPAARLLPRFIPAGLGLRTGPEVVRFGAELNTPAGFPLAVLKPSRLALSPGLRFLDRTALRALAARLPDRRLPPEAARELLHPRLAHTYEEISSYRGKLLDNLLRTNGARVHDHRDGSFHFTAPYPFLESTVGILQEFVEGRPVRSRRTGKHHPASLHVVMFDRRVVAAVYRLHALPDDGTFRDLNRPGESVFYEGAAADEEAAVQEALEPLVREFEAQFAARVRTEADFKRLQERWVLEQAAP